MVTRGSMDEAVKPRGKSKKEKKEKKPASGKIPGMKPSLLPKTLRVSV